MTPQPRLFPAPDREMLSLFLRPAEGGYVDLSVFVGSGIAQPFETERYERLTTPEVLDVIAIYVGEHHGLETAPALDEAPA